ncbi:hypothetical protein CBL_03588 [Carabus blaptoides fortunei]
MNSMAANIELLVAPQREDSISVILEPDIGLPVNAREDIFRYPRSSIGVLSYQLIPAALFIIIDIASSLPIWYPARVRRDHLTNYPSPSRQMVVLVCFRNCDNTHTQYCAGVQDHNALELQHVNNCHHI